MLAFASPTKFCIWKNFFSFFFFLFLFFFFCYLFSLNGSFSTYRTETVSPCYPQFMLWTCFFSFCFESNSFYCLPRIKGFERQLQITRFDCICLSVFPAVHTKQEFLCYLSLTATITHALFTTFSLSFSLSHVTISPRAPYRFIGLLQHKQWWVRNMFDKENDRNLLDKSYFNVTLMVKI